jgi:hypothetical protein
MAKRRGLLDRLDTSTHNGNGHRNGNGTATATRATGPPLRVVQAEVLEEPPLVSTFTAAELAKMELPPPRFAVPDILPEGLTCLAGKPKLGKSWLGFHVALAVACGGKALGRIPVDDGDVLYLALEDTKRRLQTRLRQLLKKTGGRAPHRLTLATEWPRQDKGGLWALMGWADSHPERRLIVIDTWARFRPARVRNRDSYEEDYAHASDLKALADRYKVAVTVLHHCRKMDSSDPIDSISGTLGLSGGFDGVLVLKRERGRHDATLFVTGRDVEEQELALQWEPAYCHWQLLGQAEEYRGSEERAEVFALLRREGRPLSPTEAAGFLEKTVGAVKVLFHRMEEAGSLKYVGHGKYARAGEQQAR